MPQKTAALISDIQHFSVDDGPGIRSTVFLKGCCLRCRWCHNPETIKGDRELRYERTSCKKCGHCVSSCSRGVHYIKDSEHGMNWSLCNNCLACAEVCPYGALGISGTEKTSSEVLKKLMSDKPFYRQSGGGVTVSGGEPLLQSGFCAELFAKLHGEGIHTALDTSGHVPFEAFEEVLPHTDLVLYDIKTPDPAVFREKCGGDMPLVCANLEKLSSCEKKIWIRVPLMAGLNDNEQTLEEIITLLRGKQNIEKIQLLPYHKYGLGKYESIGLPPPEFETPSGRKMNEAVKQFCSAGLQAEWKTDIPAN